METSLCDKNLFVCCWGLEVYFTFPKKERFSLGTMGEIKQHIGQ